jgi:hypothetical protein
MRRVAIVVGMMLVAGSVFAGSASAGLGKPRVYEGPLGDGETIEFDLVKRPDRPLAMREVEFSAELLCEDGTSQAWGVGLGWGGGLPRLPSHALDLDLVDPFSAIHIHGKVQAVHGEGTLSYAVAALTADETAQLCSSGELPWTVTRTHPPVEGQSPPPSPIEVRHLVMPDGTRITLTWIS